MNHRKSIQCATLLFALFGCGDDDDSGRREGGGASSSVQNSCAAICNRMGDAQCGVDLTRCEALCSEQYALTGASCRSIADRLLDCASKATFSCNADGPVATFCAELETALDGCTEGVPPGEMDVPMQPGTGAPWPAPGAGDGGVPTSAEDAGAVVEDPPAGDADAGDADAGGSPADAGPGGDEPLSCQPSPDDAPCDSCLKTQCCEQVAACGDDCLALIECFDPCLSEACLDECVALHPTGAAEFEQVLQCSAASCSSVCEDEAPTQMPGPGVRPPPEDKCLPIFAPEGTCTDPTKPVGYDCSSQPFADCVALPDIHDVYCCGA